MMLESDGKADLIIEYGNKWGLDVFIETGSAIGDLPLRCAPEFGTIVTITGAPPCAPRWRRSPTTPTCTSS